MAVTGIILWCFVLAHMIGNLKLFLSKEELNLYGEALRDSRATCSPHRAAVDAADRADRRVRLPHPRRVRAHADRTAGPGPTATSRSATTSPPTSRRARCAGPASSSPVPRLPPARPHVGHRQPRLRARRSVQQPRLQLPAACRSRSSTSSPTSRSAFHLYHGAWTMFQSLGINNPQYNNARRRVRDRVRRRHPRRQRAASRSWCNSALVEPAVPAHRSDRRLCTEDVRR